MTRQKVYLRGEKPDPLNLNEADFSLGQIETKKQTAPRIGI